MHLHLLHPPASDALTDDAVVQRVLAGETGLFELLVRRHNARVYRALRGVVREEAEVEDLMQQVYLRAFASLAQFRGTARFSTWLTRIALNEALMRVRCSGRAQAVSDERGSLADEVDTVSPGPETVAAGRQLASLLERAIDRLTPRYRTVLVLREVEGLDTAEVAELLGLSADVVRTRLSRAKVMVREALYEATGGAEQAFEFHASRCNRVTERVMSVLRKG